MREGFFLALLSLWLPLEVGARSESIELVDLTAFEETTANWSMAGGIWADPETENSLRALAGAGVIVNRPTAEAKGNLLSRLEHGDADIELQFLMAKGSNSGIYLQGRYELQLLDSWGVGQPKYSDCGGVYQRRRADGTQFEGAAPRSNACKAPGLWQDLRIAFQAPRFDAEGRKYEDAKLRSVELNGVLVHENLLLSGPTGGAIGETEVAAGPLMIQGDHGPVALRNVRVRPYDGAAPTLDLEYAVYYDSAEAPLDELQGLSQRAADATGRATRLSHLVSRFDDGFAIVYSGVLDVAAEGVYEFDLHHMGQGWLRVGAAPALPREQHYYAPRPRRASVRLEPGKHRFEVGYVKNSAVDWHQAAPPGLALFVSGPRIRRTALHSVGGLRRPRVSPIWIEASTVKVLRSFADVGPAGSPRTRIMHAINVGSPHRLNYTLDYQQGALVRAWRGAFLDATPMWHQRGDGSSKPRGAEEFFGLRPLVATLANDRATWPEAHASADFRPTGYELDASGQPVFHYQFLGARIEDAPRVVDARRIERRVTIPQPVPGVHVLLAESETVELVKPGWYALDDRRYFIHLRDKDRSLVRESDGQKLLIAAPDQGKTLVYEILF